MKEVRPPRLAEKFLLLFLKAGLAEEVLGDLDEKFYSIVAKRSLRRAQFNYWYQVLNYLRPFAFKFFRSNSNFTTMIKHNFLVSYRVLTKNKAFSIINIGGLAMGLVMAILTSLWIWDELSFDTHHQGYGQIAQVLKRRTHNGETGIRFALPIPVVDELKNSYADDFKYVVVTDWIGKNTLSSKEKNLNVSGSYMSQDAPLMLSLTMLKGTQTGLYIKDGIMLSRSTAESFFGNIDPLGEPMKVNGESSLQVVGVYEDLPPNSTFRDLKFIANFSAIEANNPWIQRARNEQFWNANFCQIYVQLNEQADMELVEEKIKHMIRTNSNNERLKASNPELVLHAMKDWHLRSGWKNGVQSGGAITNVWIFGAVALFVLILSCFNFINLSTARAQVRFKEVGVRKTMGSRRIQLIGQFMTESFLVVVLAFLIAIVMTHSLMPFFNNLSGKTLTLPLIDPLFWMLSLAVLTVTSLLAGFYPAFFLSTFRPVNALKGILSRQGSSEHLRRGLVVIQFAVSICLIVGTLVVNNQVMYSKNRDKGYDAERLITVNTSAEDFNGKHEVLHTALMGSGVVSAMSQSSSPLTEATSSNDGFSWEGKDPELTTNFLTIRVTPEFGETVKWKILEGRDFSSERLTDQKAFVCNQAAIDFMSLENPISSYIDWRGESYSIIGVVDDLLIESPFQPVRPAVYFLDPSHAEYMQIRLRGTVDTNEALLKVEEVLQSVVPDVPFDFQYVDDVFTRKFDQEERLATFLGILTIVAIAIGLMGIFGLSAYVIQQRSKEMSIRKVLGASLVSILSLFFSDFIKVIFIALVVSIPIAWYLLDSWLQGYEYRIDLSIWHFVLTSMFSVILTMLIIGQRSLQVALSNPIKFLKDE